MHYVFRLDHQLFWLINHAHNVVLDYVMLAVSSLGEFAAVWWIVAAVVLFADKRTGGRAALFVVCAILFSALLDNLLIKHLLFRERPYLVFEGVHRLGKMWANNSFPSGHASSVVAVSIVLGHYYRKLILPLIVFAVLACYSRPYLGMHFPFDVLVGAASGALCGLVILRPDRPKKVA